MSPACSPPEWTRSWVRISFWFRRTNSISTQRSEADIECFPSGVQWSKWEMFHYFRSQRMWQIHPTRYFGRAKRSSRFLRTSSCGRTDAASLLQIHRWLCSPRRHHQWDTHCSGKPDVLSKCSPVEWGDKWRTSESCSENHWRSWSRILCWYKSRQWIHPWCVRWRKEAGVYRDGTGSGAKDPLPRRTDHWFVVSWALIVLRWWRKAHLGSLSLCRTGCNQPLET